MICFREVSKRYGAVTALAGLSLEVEAGRCTVLIGPSGCGKSTLLRLANGLIRPDSGSVALGDLPVLPEHFATLRQRMGYVIQEGGLFPHLRARENITLMAEHLGWDRSRRDSRVAELARLVHLDTDLLGRYPVQLSGGQRQRVGLMRALMLDPDVLLLDEPLGALDPMIRFELQNELREIFRDLHKTVLLVTHDLAEASYFADQLVLMRAGRIEQIGLPADLESRPASDFVTRFVEAQRAPAAEDAP
jgi:osmoprotectant transport system ATP-binding protein